MAKIIGVFQTQSGAEMAMEELARLDPEHLRTAVYEGVSQDHPGGADTLAGTGVAGVPAAIPTTGGTPAFVPFSALSLDLDSGDDENFLRQMYERGATLVVAEGDEDVVQHARRIIHMNGGRFSNAD